MGIITALGRLRQEDCLEFEASETLSQNQKTTPPKKKNLWTSVLFVENEQVNSPSIGYCSVSLHFLVRML